MESWTQNSANEAPLLRAGPAHRERLALALEPSTRASLDIVYVRRDEHADG